MEFVVDGQRLKPINNEVEVLNGAAYSDLILKPRMQQLLAATTVEALLDALGPVGQSLETLGTYPQFVIQKGQQVSGDAEVLATRTVVDLTRARPAHALALSTRVERDLYAISARWGVSNRLGLAELVQFSAKLQPKPYSLAAGSASITAPLPSGRTLLEVSGFFFNEDRAWSSYALATHGISAELRMAGPADLLFKGGVRAVARSIHSISESAGDVVRAAAGTSSLKVSALAELSHFGAFHAFGAFIEAAGRPGNTHHIKAVTNVEVAAPLTPAGELVLKFQGHTGYVHSDDEKVNIYDNFFIGGPANLLGFERNKVGPRDGSDYIGGQMFYTTRIALLSKLPFKQLTPLRLKAQVDAGVLVAHSSPDLATNIRNLLKKDTALSTAAGLTYKTEQASFDVLYVFPVNVPVGAKTVENGTLHVGAELNLD